MAEGIIKKGVRTTKEVASYRAAAATHASNAGEDGWKEFPSIEVWLANKEKNAPPPKGFMAKVRGLLQG